MSDESRKVATDALGWSGRMLSGSKSGYGEQFPKNLVVFNANLIVEGDGKVWYGDIDVTRDEEKLKQIARTLKKRIYVLREHDGRFLNEAEPKIGSAVYTTDGQET